MIAGFIAPDDGDIRIGGRSRCAACAPNRRPVNMVFQHLALFPMMSVGENVGYGLARRGVARARDRERASTRCWSAWACAAPQDKRVDELSGGQRQRVAIARSLVLEPTLLLLDEPLGALDLKLREHMKIELKQLQADFGTTFVYITHDQSEALVLSDHVAVMNAGRFEQVGTPQELYYQPRTPFVAGFVGANNRIAGQRRARRRRHRRTRDGRRARGRARAASGTIAAGDAVEAFVRPEVVDARARRRPSCRPTAQRIRGRGREPAVRRRQFGGAGARGSSRAPRFRIALPQTGRFADLQVGETIAFGFDPAARRLLPRAAAMARQHAERRGTRGLARAAGAGCCCWRRRCSGSSA